MGRETSDEEPTGSSKQNGRLRIGENIAERLLDFGAAALRLSSRLPRNAPGRHVSLQLVRSASGAGANYEEARAAESQSDFAHKISLASKEMREACYWVRLVERATWSGEDLRGVVREARELSAILGASQRTARARSALENRAT